MIGRPAPRLLARVETRTLLVLLLTAAALFGFWALANEMTQGDTHAWDESLLLSLREPGDPDDPLGGGNLEEAMRDLTALGGATWLVFLTAAAAGALALMRQARSALLLLAAVAGGQLLSHTTKGFFDRPRPDLVSHEAYVHTASFPSGHSMMAAVTYLTLAAMLARATPSRRLKAYLFGLAAILTVAVGVSRVYLGVHWPSDVLRGWMIGAPGRSPLHPRRLARPPRRRGAGRGAPLSHPREPPPGSGRWAPTHAGGPPWPAWHRPSRTRSSARGDARPRAPRPPLRGRLRAANLAITEQGLEARAASGRPTSSSSTRSAPSSAT
jgi:undecaprenyl-diphosphatase